MKSLKAPTCAALLKNKKRHLVENTGCFLLLEMRPPKAGKGDDEEFLQNILQLFGVAEVEDRTCNMLKDSFSPGLDERVIAFCGNVKLLLEEGGVVFELGFNLTDDSRTYDRDVVEAIHIGRHDAVGFATQFRCWGGIFDFFEVVLKDHAKKIILTVAEKLEARERFIKGNVV